MSLINVRVPNAASDLVAIFDENLNQVFEQARPVKVEYYISSKNMEHPLEDGSVITDHRILLPEEIEVTLIISSTDYRSVYGQIEAFYRNGRLLNFQGKTRSYENMVITDIPYVEDPAMFNAVSITMKLKQVRFTTPEFRRLPPAQVANPAQADTVNRGAVSPPPADENRGQGGSLAYRAWKGL